MGGNSSNSKVQFDFKSLTPQILDYKDVKHHLEGLKFAVDKVDIQNIALTGSYGAGKSSILLTFIENFPSYKYLQISLASFNKREYKKTNTQTESVPSDEPIQGTVPPQSSPNEAEKDELERLLELSILQQIFYHVDHTKIPDSRFKRIKGLSRDSQRDVSLQVIIWLLSIWHLFFPDVITFSFMDRLPVGFIRFGMVIIFLLGLYYMVKHIRRVYNNSKVNKLNIQSGEFEIDKEVDQSVLNKHIDELLYFFEVNPYDIVIIEDLDRFDSATIFGKLREINLLLNNAEQIKRKITFIYAIRDDMFSDSSRLKFFDFIIPVIPAVDPTNARDRLEEFFRDSNVKSPNKNFLSDVSSFITDMRFLKNVFNEYCFYYNQLSADNLQPEKLFSIVLYKNFFPEDFMALQRGEGHLYNIIHSRDNLVSEKKKSIDKEIEDYKAKIKLLRAMTYRDRDELRGQYIARLMMGSKSQHPIGITINGTKYSFSTLVNPSHFNTYRNADYVYYYWIHSISPEPAPTFNHLEEQMTSNYEDQLKAVDEKKQLSQYQNDLKALVDRKVSLQNQTLANLIMEKEEFDRLFKFAGNNDVVLYLIQNGFIAEDYVEYISNFVPGTLTPKDNEFKRAILIGKNLSVDFPIEKIHPLVSELNDEHFEKEPILNLTILSFLLQNKDAFPDKLNLILDSIIRTGDRADELFWRYLEVGKNVGVLINSLSQRWPGLLDYIKEDLKDDKKKDHLSFLVLQEVENKKLLEIFSVKNLGEFLSEEPKFLSLTKDIPNEKIIELLSKTEVKFSELESPESPNNIVFNTVVLTNSYVLTDQNIEIIIKNLSENPTLASGFEISPYSTVRKSGVESLINYVENNLGEFVRRFILPSDLHQEEEPYIIDLLNQDSKIIDDEGKSGIISKLLHPVQNISAIKQKNIIDELLENSKVRPEWNIINAYFQEQGITSTLITYLNKAKNYKSLASDTPSKEEHKFLEAIAERDDLNIDAYKTLTATASEEFPIFSNINIENLQKDKVQFAIDIGGIELNQENFEILKEHHPGLHIELLLAANKDTLEELLENLHLEDKDLLAFLQSSINLPKVYQIGITELQERILRDNHKKELPQEILFEMINNAKAKDKRKLLVLYSDIPKGMLMKIIRNMEPQYSKLLEGGKQKTIPNTEINRSFAKLLETHNIIKPIMKTKKGIRLIGTGKS